MTFSNAGTPIVLPITGGTGKFRGAHDHVKSTIVLNSNNSDLAITFARLIGGPGADPPQSRNPRLTSPTGRRGCGSTDARG